ncbi:MAG: T9SS type A sorting domain-containing protein [Lewinellaceae bacterium]|nr:T9SS type A sorting domain-containing protein [Lewinellaceae bacterium]
MRQIIFTLIFFTCYHLHSQKLLRQAPVKPWEPVTFANMHTKWTLDVFDSTYIEPSKFNGYNVFDVIDTKGDFIKDGKLYLCSTILKHDWTGFRVSCVDINSGALLWARNIDMPEFGYQLLPMYQTFDQEGNIVIVGFRRPYDPKQLSWHVTDFNCKLFTVNLNAENGFLNAYHSPDSNPNFLFSVHDGSQDWDIYGINTNNELNFLFKRHYFDPNFISVLYKGKIDAQANFIVEDTIQYNFPDLYKGRSTFIQKDGKYYTYEISTKNLSYSIIALDTTTLEEVSRADITYFGFQPYYAGIYWHSDKYLMIAQAYPSPWNYNIRSFLCDYEGHLIKTFELNDALLSKYEIFTLFYDESLDRFIVICYDFKGNATTHAITYIMDVYLVDDGSFALKKKVEMSHPGDATFQNTFIPLEDGDFIVENSLGYYYYNSTGELVEAEGNRSTGLMRITREELGIKPVAVEDIGGGQDLAAFPNPSAGAFHLHLCDVDGTVNIHMYDINGYNVYTAKGFSADDISLDLEFLPQGAYIYKVEQDNKTLGAGKWIRE